MTDDQGPSMSWVTKGNLEKDVLDRILEALNSSKECRDLAFVAAKHWKREPLRIRVRKELAFYRSSLETIWFNAFEEVRNNLDKIISEKPTDEEWYADVNRAFAQLDFLEDRAIAINDLPLALAIHKATTEYMDLWQRRAAMNRLVERKSDS